MAQRILLIVLWFLLPLGAFAQPGPSVEQLIEQGRRAGADSDLMRQVAQRAEQAGFSKAETAQLLQPAVQLAQRELPSRGVLQKAVEGLAKQVSPPRISPVLQRMQGHTEQAGTLIRAWSEQPAVRAMVGQGRSAALDEEARNQLIQSAAQARMQDVPPDVMQQLLEALPAETKRRPIAAGEVAAALHVLPELMGDGASPETSIQLLTRALDAGYGSSNVRQLPTAMRVARQQTRHPADVLARNAARAIAQGTPAADVLGRLFDGGMPGGGPPAGVGGPPDNVPPGQGKPPDTPPGNGPGNGPPGQGEGGG